MDHQIAMLWERGALSFLEQLCLNSFLSAGHPVRIFSYGPVENAPEGVEFADADGILPETEYEMLWSGARRDAFRSRLLAQIEGTIWVEPDVYCLRPFEPVNGMLFGWADAVFVGADVLALPAGGPVLERLLEATEVALVAAKAGAQACPSLGTRLLTEVLRESGALAEARGRETFYSCAFEDRLDLLTSGAAAHALPEDSNAVRLYSRRLASHLMAHSHGLPDPESLLGGLLQDHRIDPCAAPLADCPHPDRTHPFARRYLEAAYGRDTVAAVPVRPLDQVVAVSLVRNEAPFLLDWIAYHLGIGITQFLIYAEDCSDGTEAMLDALAERGVVTRGRLPSADGRPMRAALDDAATHPLVRRADAVVVMDVDEYINIHVGEGRLRDLFAAAGDPDLISMTWRLFGTSGAVSFEDRPVAEQFTRAAPDAQTL